MSSFDLAKTRHDTAYQDFLDSTYIPTPVVNFMPDDVNHAYGTGDLNSQLKNVYYQDYPVLEHLYGNTCSNGNKIKNMDTSDDVMWMLNEFSVGSMVIAVTDVTDDLHGVIKWIDYEMGMAGVEIDEMIKDVPLTLTDGTLNGRRYFQCGGGRALFIPIKQLRKDNRFEDMENVTSKQYDIAYSKLTPTIVKDITPPLKISELDDLQKICKKFSGIQGHQNSCYLDSTLFAMFMFTSVFDSVLFRKPQKDDLKEYLTVQRILKEEIVFPMRHHKFVHMDSVMKLRYLLAELTKQPSYTSDEKDPEEFLNCLFSEIMHSEPLLKLSSGQDTFCYQLFVEKCEDIQFPSVQQLLEQSFLTSNIKLAQVPSCLILQMPRFGKDFKMYNRIVPTLVLDVTDIIDDSPRTCSICGSLATCECKGCFTVQKSLTEISYCSTCYDTRHTHDDYRGHTHQAIAITTPQGYLDICAQMEPPRIYMELFAVICIEKSHYVSFVKTGLGYAPWCFFDSMYARFGNDKNGRYNVPEIIPVPELPKWLDTDNMERLNTTPEKNLPEHVRRLFCDAYLCMYLSNDCMMYK